MMTTASEFEEIRIVKKHHHKGPLLKCCKRNGLFIWALLTRSLMKSSLKWYYISFALPKQIQNINPKFENVEKNQSHFVKVYFHILVKL